MKYKNVVRIICLTLIITFLIIYLAQATGYYEVKNSNKTKLTNEAIKRYEKDIKEGKNVDVNDYVEEEKVYSNNITKLTSNVSRGIEKSLNYIMNYMFKEMSKAVKESNSNK